MSASSSFALALAEYGLNMVTLTIKDPKAGTTTIIEISGTLTVKDLKEKYVAKLGTDKLWNGYTLSLYTSVTPLLDSAKISSISKLTHGIILNATYQDPPIMINIRGLDGRTKKITSYANWTVRRLKEEYAMWLGQGWDNVVMLYKARRLKDDDLLKIYNIEPEGFIQANIRSIGGVLVHFDFGNLLTLI